MKPEWTQVGLIISSVLAHCRGFAAGRAKSGPNPLKPISQA